MVGNPPFETLLVRPGDRDTDKNTGKKRVKGKDRIAYMTAYPQSPELKLQSQGEAP